MRQLEEEEGRGSSGSDNDEVGDGDSGHVKSHRRGSSRLCNFFNFFQHYNELYAECYWQM
jgi:hypothetical protein